MNENKSENKLKVRDLINIGVFSAIYLAGVILVLGVFPIPIYTVAVCALLLSPVYLLLIAKVQKPFCILIMGFICSLILGLILNGNVVYFAVNLAFFTIAEFIARAGKYKSFKMNALSYIVAAYWLMGEIGALWFAKDYIYGRAVKGNPDNLEWVESFMAMGTTQNLIFVLCATFVGGVLSVLFARKLFNKHFVKAGII